MPRKFLVTAMALVTIAAAYLVAHRQDTSISIGDQGDAPSSPPSPGATEPAPDGAAVRRAEEHPLQSYLLSMVDAPRDSVFLSMIRDAGLSCDGLLNATQLVEEAASWRISCIDARAYLLVVDGFGDVHVEPLYYVEHPFATRPAENIIPEPDTQR